MEQDPHEFPPPARTRVLFVCGRNQWRSPTAERMYRDDPRVEVRSAGVSAGAKRRVSAKDLAWADLALVMERAHRSRIREQFRDEPELPAIESLDIPDEFEFMDAELIRLLREGVEECLGEWLGNDADAGD